MTHEGMLASITRQLVKAELQIHPANPEMALGIAIARRIMEKQYEELLKQSPPNPSQDVQTSLYKT